VTKEQVVEKLMELIYHLEHDGQYGEAPTADGKGVVEWVADVIEKKDKRTQDLKDTLTEVEEAASDIVDMTYFPWWNRS